MPKRSGRPPLIESWVRDQPEVFCSSTETSSRVRAAAEAGLVRKIAPRLYTRNLTTDPAEVVAKHLWEVLALLAPPGAVVGFRTSFEGRPGADGHVWLSAPYARYLEVPGLRIHLVPGPGALEGDRPFVGTMFLASEPRALLENLMRSRTRGGARRAVGRSAVEQRLETILRSRGEAGLNAVRDAARVLAPTLGAEAAFCDLSGLIAAALGSHPTLRARHPALRARLAGLPYDVGVIARLNTLGETLHHWEPVDRPDATRDGSTWDTLAFFDAYFSNYIEGTQFEVGEALDIVFHQNIPDRRPADAHDVLGTYRLVADPDAMGQGVEVWATFDRFESTLRRWHALLMAGRPEVGPGEWKVAPNQAGGSHFVPPNLVRGTLKAGFERIRGFATPFARAVSLKVLLTEVHPFTDGNGRLSRAVMNAELISGRQRRILIPTVYREDYLGALRRLTRQGDASIVPLMLDRAQAFTAAISFADRDMARAQMEQHNAFRDASEARLLVPVPHISPPPRGRTADDRTWLSGSG